MQTISTAFSERPPLPGAYTPKRNELVAAKFSADGVWYRAKIMKINSPTDILVHYVDFGNSESVTNQSIAALPSGISSPALASEYHLAFLSAPSKDWSADAIQLV